MKTRTIRTIVVLFGAMLSSAAQADESVAVLEFPAAEIAEADKRTMTRYRSSPVNLRCDYVSVDIGPLLALVSNLENGTIPVGSSQVLVRLPGREPLTYVGIVYEGTQRHGKDGPFLWEGKLEGGARSITSLVIDKKTGARAYISTAQGMYRLSPSSQRGRYFLCQRDPGFRSGSS